MRSICIAIATFLLLMGESNALAADCGAPDDDGPSSKAHIYELSVKSTSGSPVRIVGSVALMGPDSFVQIDVETPYKLTVCGMNILLIVSALDTKDRIDFSLSVDSQVSTFGADNTVYAVGDDIPKRGSLFSSNYRVQNDNG